MNQELSDAENAQFNILWKHLCDIQDDLVERFVDEVLNQVDDDDRSILMPHVEQMLSWQKSIADNIEAVGNEHLSEYATRLKNTTLIALKLCKKYGVYDDIKSFSYITYRQAIKLNGEYLYFLGEVKHLQEDPQEYVCPKCSSPNIISFSVMHLKLQNGLIYRTSAFEPPRGKGVLVAFIFSIAFIIGSIQGFFFGAAGAFSATVIFFIGIAFGVYAGNAAHYNEEELPSMLDAWERSFYCEKCGQHCEVNK